MFKWFRKDPNNFPDNLYKRKAVLYKVYHTLHAGAGIECDVQYFDVKDFAKAIYTWSTYSNEDVNEGEIKTTSIRWIDFDTQQEQVIRRAINSSVEGLSVNDNYMDVDTAPVWATWDTYKELKEEMKDA